MSTGSASPSVRTGAELRVEDLFASYDDQVVLQGVSVTVRPGECVSVLGANGAGKTTLMNSIAGVHKAWRGRIDFGERSLAGLRGHQVAAAGVCYVPQGRGVFPDLSVADNLSISVGRDTATRDRVFEYFPMLRDYAKRPAGTLSGGEQQMLSMAPALVGQFNLVLVDELSLGLAPKIVESLFLLLAQIRQRGVSILLVEQFAERGLALSDRAYVIRKGRVVYDGPAADLRGQQARLHALYLGEGTDESAQV
jgi:ABC-type branched-subunit amino acid transport system ATPase component